MRQYVKKYITSCYECLFHKENTNARKMSLHPIEKTPTPFHTIHVDHLGPFVKSQRGNQYVIAIVDSFTKYVYIKAVRDTTTRLVLGAIKELGYHFGSPVRIITNRGTAFTSASFDKFCKENATATPRANGQIEIYNHTILRALRPLSDQNDRCWDNHLPNIQWSINCLPNDVTKISPQQLLFGFTPRPMCNDKLKLCLFDEKDQHYEDNRDDQRAIADERIRANQCKQKKRFDMLFKDPIVYNVGDLVVIFREPPSTGESRKLARKCKGPYLVTAVLHGDRYKVEDTVSSDGRRRFKGVVPSDHMRLVVTPDEDIECNSGPHSSEED